MRYRLVVRLTPADVGKRVVIRWRPGPGDSEQVTDVLGMLEQADAGSFAVRTREGNLVVIPAGAGPAPSLPDRRPADAAWPLSRRPPAAAHPACDRP
jgi:N-acetylglutamate synthase